MMTAPTSDLAQKTEAGQLIPAEWNHIRRLLDLIPQYRNHISISLSTISTNDIYSVARYVRDCRLAKARGILAALKKEGISPYQPVISLAGGRRRVIVPPVLEIHASRAILLDGTHRVWVAREANIPTLTVILVAGVPHPLPCEVLSWSSMLVRSDHYSSEENLVNLKRSHFRPLTTTFNSDACFLE